METAYGLGRGRDRFEKLEVVGFIERYSTSHDSVEELVQPGGLETVHGWRVERRRTRSRVSSEQRGVLIGSKVVRLPASDSGTDLTKQTSEA